MFCVRLYSIKTIKNCLLRLRFFVMEKMVLQKDKKEEGSLWSQKLCMLFPYQFLLLFMHYLPVKAQLLILSYYYYTFQTIKTTKWK